MPTEAEAQDRWQPIETAPRDGTKVWGMVEEDAISMFWHPKFEAFVSTFNRMTLAAGLTFADTGLNYQDHSPTTHRPTHWQPLPAPPRTPA